MSEWLHTRRPWPGDAEFALYQFSYTWQCRDGRSPRDCSFLQNDTVYAKCEWLRGPCAGPAAPAARLPAPTANPF